MSKHIIETNSFTVVMNENFGIDNIALNKPELSELFESNEEFTKTLIIELAMELYAAKSIIEESEQEIDRLRNQMATGYSEIKKEPKSND